MTSGRNGEMRKIGLSYGLLWLSCPASRIESGMTTKANNKSTRFYFCGFRGKSGMTAIKRRENIG
jgi:hypothetical protein